MIVSVAGPTDAGYGISAIPEGGGGRVPLVGESLDSDFPAVSRDGVWVVYSNSGSLYVLPRLGGAVRRLTTGTDDREPSFSPDGRTIVFNRAQALYTIPLTAGHAPTPIIYSDNLERASFTPDGKAVIAEETPGGTVVEHTLGGDRTRLAPGELPQLSQDGTKVTFIRVTAVDSSNHPTQSQIWTMPIGGKPTLLSSARGGLNLFPAWSPNGDAVYFEHDTDLAAVIIKVPVNGSGATVVRGAPGDDVMSPAVYDADVTAPKVTLLTPAARTDTNGTLTVRFAGTDSGTGVASYDVRYRRARYDGNFGSWSYPAVGIATKGTSVGYTLARGDDTCFAVRARDHAGNVSAWSGEKCTTLPLDDHALTASAGWTRTSSTGSYLSTVTTAHAKGKTLRLPAVHLVRGWLIATRCSTCGSVTVAVGGRVLGTVSLKAARTQRQVFLPLPGAGVLHSGPLVLTTRSTATTTIDGLAIARS